jgi:protein arginine N-methyltransferase 1
MYSLKQYASMFADRVRMDAYAAAIQKAVRPGDAIVDLGCGPGIFALLACTAGASHVYAIDLNGIVEFGRHLAVVNGFADRIDFLRGDSRQMHLPVRANVIVSDLRGALPLFSHAVGTLQDARARFLAEGGTLIPLRDTLVAAVVELPDFHREITNSWKSIPHLDLSTGLPLVLNSVYRHSLKPQQLLSESQSWHVLDYTSGVQSQARSTLQLCATRSAVGHGVGLWFETELMEGIGYSTEPRSGETVYGHVFLPWLEPVSLREGDVCTVDLCAHLVGNDYVWQWETRVPAAEGRDAIRFRQSTFYGSLFSPSYLKKHSTDFVPVLSESGLAERWLLQAMDGKRPLEKIAAEAVVLFPHVFRRAQDAFNRAGELAEKFSR